jgi:hypothetical protein
MLQGRQTLELFGPRCAVATGGQPASEPAQTLWLNDHKNRFLSEEDFVGGRLAYAWPSVFVEHLQQGPGAQADLAAVAAQVSNAGGTLTQENGEEAAGHWQADAFRLGRTDELGLESGGADDSAALLNLELLETPLQLGDLLLQAGDLLPGGRRVEVAQDGVGFAIQPLPRNAALLGVLTDVSMRAEEDDSGTGKTRRWQ